MNIDKTNINKIIEQVYFFYFLKGEPHLNIISARRSVSPK